MAFKREVAKYLFAHEIKGTTIQFTVENKDDSKFASVHVITPTGQDVSRVLVCGTLTESEDIGDNDSYYRGRIIDPTGATIIYAGNYQPDALRSMGMIQPPAHVAAIGKVNLFTAEDGTVISSIRPESIAEVDEDTIRTWSFMAAKNLIEHIEGTSSEVKESAKEQYGDVQQEYKDMAVSALESLLRV